MVASSVYSRAKFDIHDLNPIEGVGESFIPTFFGHGQSDDFVKPHHTEDIYERYAGDKQILLFDGDHNSARPYIWFNKAFLFLFNTL